ncbi:MAG TPA: phosphohistidine phosphatase SixA [Thermoanaerobaculia bacterium]|nr:phosphohistidine phosphatase SixA [Thermoanaerobaculia bacterium]
MRVYVARHGEAEGGGADRRRRLTARGRERVERLGRALAADGVAVTSVRHSGRARAAETAEILARHLGGAVDPRPLAELDPDADPLAASRWIEGQRVPMLLVGHLPLVERLVAVLEGVSPEDPRRSFPAGAVACLERDGDGAWEVLWVRMDDH